MRKLIVVALLLIFTGCRSSYEETHNFVSAEWKKFETLKFQAVMENTGDYSVNFKITYTEKMQNEIFAMGVTMHTPYGEERYLERKINLFEEGKPTGHKNEQGKYEYIIDFFQAVDFKEKGLYEFDLENLMPSYKTNGIHAIQLQILPTPK